MTNIIKRYSDPFRRQVVQEYEAGVSIPELCKKYGIGGPGTITRWVKKFGKGIFRHELVRIQSADEIQRVSQLEKQVQELEAALGRMTLEKLKLESIVEVLQDNTPEGVKKNGLSSSAACVAKFSNKAKGQ